MIYQREALKDLQEWARSRDRRPLVLRGARQVGKSTLVKEFGKEFDHFIEFNLELDKASLKLFDDNNGIEDFIAALQLRQGIPKFTGRCLLFIDEVQESAEAIWMLRYFYEQRPEIYVIAAGSLLEFSFGEIKSFPVGRVQYYYLHPLTFREFLLWTDQLPALEVYDKLPFPRFGIEFLFEHYHKYLTIGGMPAVVSEYIESGGYGGLSARYDMIWGAYKQDIGKYAETRAERDLLVYILESAPAHEGRLTFSKFGGSSFKSREMATAFRTLELAKVLSLIYPTTKVGLPATEDRSRSPKIQILDTGLLNYAVGIQPQLIGIDNFMDAYSGRLVEHMLTQELTARYTTQDVKPKFWVRENANANAEVDLVYQHHQYLLPVEVKSGAQGRLRSLHQFMDRAPHPYAIRFLRNEFSVEQYNTIAGTPYLLMNLPYFLMGKIGAYAEYLIAHYSLGEDGVAKFKD